MKNIEDYRSLSLEMKNICVPMYSYVEGEEHTNYWLDSQNCLSYFFDDEYIKEHELDKKNYWLIDPMVPKSVKKITEENKDTVEVAYFVSFSSIKEDVNKEFDIDNLKVIRE